VPSRLRVFFGASRNLCLAARPRPWPLRKPRVLQFPVNDICNAHCQMCHIWQQKLDKQITPMELAGVLRSPLFSKVTGVGVNGGEPTLREDLAELVDVLCYSLPSLSSIALITNGLNSQQVIERLTEVGKVTERHGVKLDVMVSLDGIGKVHDRVRGTKSAFANAVKVVDFVTASDLVDTCRLGCTVIRENIYGLHDLLDFAVAHNIYIKYRLGVPHQRLYTRYVAEPFSLSPAEKYHFAIFLENLIKYYEQSAFQRHFYRSLISQMIYDNPRTAGCDWQYQGATLSARGDLSYCAVESKSLGSAVTEDPEKLYFGNKEYLRTLVKTKCHACKHDYLGLPSFNSLLHIYASKLKEKVGLSIRESRARWLWQLAGRATRWLRFQKRQTKLKRRGTSHLHQSIATARVRKRSVLICGWYGSETLGDKAIIGGVVSALQATLGDVELHLASLEPYISEMTVRQMPELGSCRVHSIAKAMDLVRYVDLVVFAGGPIMAIDPLAEMVGIFLRARAAQVTTVVAGCGVGPLGTRYHNSAIRRLLELASYRIYRDQESLLLARSLGVDTDNDLVAEDPAFTWLEGKRRDHEQEPRQPKLLLGLRQWPHEQYARNLGSAKAEEIRDNFEKKTIMALKALVDRFPNLSIIPFPMCTNHIGGDDRWFYREFFRGQGKLQQAIDTTFLSAEVPPLQAVEVFLDSTAVLAMRYHSLVFALALGVPAVSIDYTLGQGKVKALADSYNVPYESLNEVNAEFIVEGVSKILRMQEVGSQYVQAYCPPLFKEAMDIVMSRSKLNDKATAS